MDEVSGLSDDSVCVLGGCGLRKSWALIQNGVYVSVCDVGLWALLAGKSYLDFEM